MLPYFGEHFANPSSGHVAGRTAGDAVERARTALGALVGLPPASVVFTAGGTEADVLALRGAVLGAPRPVSVVVSAVQHPAVLETARSLAGDGVEVRIAGVDHEGRVDPAAVAALVD